ncbi:MAG: malto-oligosyltrehalose synthase [Actinomycetaceae bacterium]|nr:malto-oligosyltrehalose synthase [Actinomycetaceae bacterium]MDU0969427.1 malto-oligosyltrehalose synthase [Actinomycetaceae bacterium]
MSDPVNDHPHLPTPNAHQPITTYRLQLSPTFTFADAEQVVPYLADLGITDVYLSPILQAAPGSTHGYDVVSHSAVSADLGGISQFKSLANTCHEAGLHVVVDLVPNHMAVPTPVWHNRAMWSVLKRGAASPYAKWFDVDMDSPILMPVLGARIGQVIANQELEVVKRVIPTEPERGEQWVLTYYDHVFPIAEGTESLPLGVLVERQHYRLAHWKVADEELNYRRFFDVGTLAAIRVEDPDVFAATHRLLIKLYTEGYIDAFRVDHPDGLANPRDYFRHLSAATGRAWIAAEKILEGSETLPADWAVAGTTGYDTAWRLTALQVDPQASLPLGALMQKMTGDSPASYHQVVEQAKGQIIDTSLAAEIRRLGQIIWNICQDDLRLRDYTYRSVINCLRGLIIEMPVYRAYVVPDEPAPGMSRQVVESAAERALAQLGPDDADTMEMLLALLLSNEVGSAGLDTSDERRDEVVVRFQQVCGAVQAKGVEDTAFYRWTHLCALTEVGGSPERFGITPDELHAFAAAQQENWPATMTCGTTHDTKRDEDVRSRLVLLSQYPHLWATTLVQLQAVTQEARPSDLDGRTENLLWQTLAGTWTEQGPISDERLIDYLRKSVREMKTWTTWTQPDEVREEALFHFASFVRHDDQVATIMDQWVSQTTRALEATVLSTKALQLTLPGVADIYQGSEITNTRLVDPDNRRPVNFEQLAIMLRGLDEGEAPTSLDTRKLQLTAAIARLRRERPEVFVSAHASYDALPTSSGRLVAFARGINGDAQVVTVATRLAGTHDEWRTPQTVVLPEGRWRDIVSRRTFSGGAVTTQDLLGKHHPAVVLTRVGDDADE